MFINNPKLKRMVPISKSNIIITNYYHSIFYPLNTTRKAAAAIAVTAIYATYTIHNIALEQHYIQGYHKYDSQGKRQKCKHSHIILHYSETIAVSTIVVSTTSTFATGADVTVTTLKPRALKRFSTFSLPRSSAFFRMPLSRAFRRI